MTPSEFYRERFGPNWVVARRSPSILRRYGADVVCISRKQMAEADRDYRCAYGDPYDPVRAELYLSCKVLVERYIADAGGKVPADVLRAYGALENEIERPVRYGS